MYYSSQTGIKEGTSEDDKDLRWNNIDGSVHEEVGGF